MGSRCYTLLLCGVSDTKACEPFLGALLGALAAGRWLSCVLSLCYGCFVLVVLWRQFNCTVPVQQPCLAPVHCGCV